ncbi:MAG: DNA (cytosine-5-)-methyltransferase [Ruminococcus sp.]|nr:DNA (cytosine-5-)-methyltransferase [Ruminococcus sp.]
MKVLSLFDGISCGMVALERAGIPVERYVAYEIDKYAIKVSQKNYPQIEHCGNVFNVDYTRYKGFDLLIGGSPCTYWSIANNNRETTPDGEGGKLFMEYVRALKESGCRYFLYENNYSIHKNIKAFISEQLEVQPIMINSTLVSAQQRKRCYWTNIPNVAQPKDKGILLKDIIGSGIAERDKSRCFTASGGRTTTREFFGHSQGQMIAEPVIIQRGHGFNKGGIKSDKSPTLTANGSWQDNNHIAEPILLNTKNGKSQTIKATSSNVSIANITTKGNHGATGVAIMVNDSEKSIKQNIYSVKNGEISFIPKYGIAKGQEKTYKVNLPDGKYIIRKLTPIEAERLQTLPDNYTEGISNTQRYKCIGNGWTVDVIAHILKNLHKKKTAENGNSQTV